MPKWKIVRRRAESPLYIQETQRIEGYSNNVVRQLGLNVTPAIRVVQLVSFAGVTVREMGLEPTGPERINAPSISSQWGEYNGSGYHFIRVREDVTVDDFEIEIVDD